MRALLWVFLGLTLAGAGLLATLPGQTGSECQQARAGARDDVEQAEEEEEEEVGDVVVEKDEGEEDAEAVVLRPLLEEEVEEEEEELGTGLDWVTLALQCPLFFYSGIQAAYAVGDLTAHVVEPLLGKAMIGGVMVCYFLTNAASSVISGFVSSGGMKGASVGRCRLT